MTDQMEQSWSANEAPQDFSEKILALSYEVKGLKSNAIFMKLRRYMYFETFVGLAACVWIAKEIADHQNALLLYVVLALFAIFNTYYYVQFLKNADRLFLKDTRSALEGIIALLKGFIKRLEMITVVLTPLLAMLIFYSKTTYAGYGTYWELPLSFLGIQFAIAIGLTLFGWLILKKSIIPKTYAKWLSEFEKVHQGLVTEE